MTPRLIRRYLASPRRSFITFLVILAFLSFLKHRKYHNRKEFTKYESERKQKEPEIAESYISKTISQFNSEERILNKELYGNVRENTVIFVVLVNKYSSNFKFFLMSLSEVRGIEDALIIFSHSFFDEALNKIIRGIQFCRVLQIFYPYSVQTHSRTYPGHHPSDCHSNTNKILAEKTNCTGANFPDIRGHYRDPIKAERKHYWWWTTNHVFESLNCSTNHNGLFIFLEPDFILMPDFIYMASYMKSVATSLPQCEFLSMGSNSPPNTKHNVYAVEFTTWDPNVHTGVLAFDADTWNIIAAHYDLFCDLDDTSWSRALEFISYKRRDGKKFKVISIKTPRAFRIADIRFMGIFSYDLSDVFEKVMGFQKANERYWFPPHLELYIDVEVDPGEGDFTFDYSALEGGWADPRDKGLCKNITTSKMKKIISEIQNDLTM